MRWSIVFPAFLLAAACDEPNVHILTAQLYEPAGACLTASEGVDVVNGPSTGDNCNPTCLTIASSGTTSVYLTPMCPPFPGDYTVEAADAATDPADPCTGAFAALAEYNDSGVTCPAVSDEGGDEAGDAGDAMADARADAGTDAAGDAPATD